MAMARERKFTGGDLLTWDDGKRYELYDGRPFALASPTSTHQRISAELLRQLGNFLVDKPCRVFAAPYDVFLFAREGDSLNAQTNLVQPDLCVICDASKIEERGCRGAPDLVIEILSPSSRGNDRVKKFNLYQEAGVREYWIVSPEERSVWSFVLRDGRYESAAAGGPDGAFPVQIMPDCRVDLARVFPRRPLEN